LLIIPFSDHLRDKRVKKKIFKKGCFVEQFKKEQYSYRSIKRLGKKRRKTPGQVFSLKTYVRKAPSQRRDYPNRREKNAEEQTQDKADQVRRSEKSGRRHANRKYTPPRERGKSGTYHLSH